jgi:hypothetical protein
VALLIALFTLLLISAVGLALVFASGTESALAANYRSSTAVFYAATAGLEEARGRLSGADPNFFGAFVASPGATLPLGEVRYVRNPLGGETVAPLTAGNAYQDTTYVKQFGTAPDSTKTQYVNSVWPIAGVQGPVYKWVRINAITEQSINTDVNKDNVLDNATALFYDGAKLNLAGRGAQAYGITSLAALPDGSRKVVDYVVATSNPITVDAAIHTLLQQQMGDALNVTGLTDPVCTLPPQIGSRSGQKVSTPGPGNVTGYPTGTLDNAAFPYKLAALIQSFKSSQPIDTPGTGVTGTGTPAVAPFNGPHAVLGTAPTVGYDNNGGITKITAPGTALVLASPGDLTLGVPTVGGAPVTGQGVLIVQGNLKIDITNGFNYFGLILVTGNITMTANSSTSASSNIHGAIIGGGTFTSNLSNLSGSIFIHQNACMVQNQFSSQALSVLSFRELPQ